MKPEQKHWIAQMLPYPKTIISGDEAEARAQEYRDAGWTVSGPFVLEAQEGR